MISLLQGMVSERQLNLLLQLTKVHSEDVQDALHDHLVKGWNEATAAALNGIRTDNFNRSLRRLKEVADIVNQLNEPG